LYIDGAPFGLPIRTRFPPLFLESFFILFLIVDFILLFYFFLGVLGARLESGGASYCWNELITMSTKYRDLTAHSQLAFTVIFFLGELLPKSFFLN
jgi:hypothetical protein